MQIKICIDNVSNEFNAFEDAIQFLQTANADIVSSKLIKLLDNKAIKEWIKAHNNCLPLGSLNIKTDSNGSVEIYSLVGIYSSFCKSSYGISKDDLIKLEDIISNEDNIVIENAFTALYKYELTLPSIRYVIAKFNADFSSFELEEDLIERDCWSILR